MPLLLIRSNENNPIIGRTRFQKLLFLAQKQYRKKWYFFVPYNYGPYSPELQKDVEFLIDHDLIKETFEPISEGRTLYRYYLSNEGHVFIDKILNDYRHREQVNNIINIFSKLNKKYHDYTMDRLINLVYNKYPEYTGRSVYQR